MPSAVPMSSLFLNEFVRMGHARGVRDVMRLGSAVGFQSTPQILQQVQVLLQVFSENHVFHWLQRVGDFANLLGLGVLMVPQGKSLFPCDFLHLFLISFIDFSLNLTMWQQMWQIVMQVHELSGCCVKVVLHLLL